VLAKDVGELGAALLVAVEHLAHGAHLGTLGILADTFATGELTFFGSKGDDAAAHAKDLGGVLVLVEGDQ
jgi:hypothetical protein